jgi:hypothetical protein
VLLITSFVNLGAGVVRPVDELFFFEPKIDLVIGGLDSIRTVADVSTNVDTEISSDSTWLRVLRLGGTEHLSTSGNGIVTFPNHGADGT